FTDKPVSTTRSALACGDYGLMADGRLVAAVERKSLSDLSSSVLNGNLRYQLIELSALPRAAVVVEDRYSEIFGLTFARPAVVADGIATTPQRLSSPTTDGHERALSLVFARPVAQQTPRAEGGTLLSATCSGRARAR